MPEIIVTESVTSPLIAEPSNGSRRPANSNRSLTNKEALLILHQDVNVEIESMKAEFLQRNFSFWLKNSISFKSELSKMRWPSVMFMTAYAIAHFVVVFVVNVEDPATSWVGFQGLMVTALLLANLIINLWDTKQRFGELLLRSEQFSKLIYRCSQDKQLLEQWRRFCWNSGEAKTLFIPKSPCIHQTITYRECSCLNLPDYLLVRGDIIHLYPGERAPGDCISLKTVDVANNTTLGEASKISLAEGEIFHTTQPGKDHSPDSWPAASDREDLTNSMVHARLKNSNKGTDFLMLSTPYVKSLRISLQRSHKRPVNSVEKECFIVFRGYFERFVIPLVFALSTFVTAIHYVYLDLTDSDQQIKTISIAYLLLRPSLTIMPFLPWMFPCFWLIINAYGSARLLCCAEFQIKRAKENYREQYENNLSSPRDGFGMTNQKFENLLATPTVGGGSESKNGEEDLQELHSNVEFWQVFRLFLDLILGKGGHVWRSSSLLQVLGCLTSLCFIDKVGILSWPNPSPEKVFILAHDEKETNETLDRVVNHSDDLTSQTDCIESGNHQSLESDRKAHNMATRINLDPSYDKTPTGHGLQLRNSRSVNAEVLDVSQSINLYRGMTFDQIIPQQHSKLQFDDLSWRKYMNNLKPLGLSIMLNNCCEDSFGDYFRFYKHVCYESIIRCNLTPVVKRRCVCGLSKLIGFTKNSVQNYKYTNQVGIYKLIDPDNLKKENLVPSLENTTRLKLPFPNMVSNIHQDAFTGGYQAFSSGAADVILDACMEFWDGSQLVPLNHSHRKKIMDFYHRTSLTSYCCAFAYAPLLDVHNLGDRYIELPPDNSKLAQPLRKLDNEHQEQLLQNHSVNLLSHSPNQASTTYVSSQDDVHDSGDYDSDPRVDTQHQQSHRATRRCLSVEEIDTRNDDKEPSKKSRRLNMVLDELTDQVFVGQVALQYQPCPDFVALVEQLEHACIRFVHFSKENELRSRVFSEKMGLESGWNCHISLQSDQDLDDALRCDSGYKIPEHQAPYAKDSSDSDVFTPSTRISSILIGSPNVRSSNNQSTSCGSSISSDERTLYSWKSLPSLVMRMTSKIHFGPRSHKNTESDQSDVTENFREQDDSGQSDIEVNDEENKGEGLDSLAFDMSNRAKLPKGIENIRPHLATVDNIPLQVSLFTDCTPELTREMIEIMQDAGEIVCVIGSSSSKSNTTVFLQANASIAIEPLNPTSCCHKNFDKDKFKIRVKKHIVRKGNSLSHSQQQYRAQDKVDSDFTAIQIQPRLNNPRDRLGIRANDGLANTPGFPRPQPHTHQLDSSSSSSDSSSSCYEENEFADDMSEDELLDDLMDNQTEDGQVSSSLAKELPNPNSLASRLASLPCSYSYSREEPVNLFSLIMEARHYTFKMKNTFVCMMCFAMSISSAQFLTSILFLPPMLSSGLTIWLTVVVVPLMSFSLMNTSMDSQVMKIAVGKNLQLKPENITFFVICYLIKFIPSVIVVVFSFGLIIAHSCKLTGFGSSSLGPCWMFTYVQHGNATSSDSGDQDLLWSTHLLTAQVCASFLLVLYFVVISSGFVHRSHLLWQRSPTRNKVWVLISSVLILGQLLYNHLLLHLNINSSKMAYEFLASLPAHIWLISFVWPVVLIGINLLVKRAEIKATIRQQRRARFDFNTKLGMNSPF